MPLWKKEFDFKPKSYQTYWLLSSPQINVIIPTIKSIILTKIVNMAQAVLLMQEYFVLCC